MVWGAASYYSVADIWAKVGLLCSSSCSAYRSRHAEYNNVASSNENPDLVCRFVYIVGRCI